MFNCETVLAYWDQFLDEFVSLEWFPTIRMSSGKN
jgi:hypothetical protein